MLNQVQFVTPFIWTNKNSLTMNSCWTLLLICFFTSKGFFGPQRVLVKMAPDRDGLPRRHHHDGPCWPRRPRPHWSRWSCILVKTAPAFWSRSPCISVKMAPVFCSRWPCILVKTAPVFWSRWPCILVKTAPAFWPKRPWNWGHFDHHSIVQIYILQNWLASQSLYTIIFSSNQLKMNSNLTIRLPPIIGDKLRMKPGLQRCAMDCNLEWSDSWNFTCCQFCWFMWF